MDYGSVPDFKAAAKAFVSEIKKLPPSEWTFGGYADILACVMNVILKWNAAYPAEPMVDSKTPTWLKFFKQPQRTLLVLTGLVESQQL